MIEFTSDLEIGIEELDSEHRRLFDLINGGFELLQNQFIIDKYDRVKAMMEELEDYANEHFTHEEAYMESIKDPELIRQRIQHNHFRDKIHVFSVTDISDDDELHTVLEELLNYLGKWLYGHIIGTDTMIGHLPPLEDWMIRENPCEFTEEYHTGIAIVDAEHKELFRLSDKVYQMSKLGVSEYDVDEIMSIIGELKTYTEEHFADEEEYMQSINYEGIEAQKRAHRSFIEEIAGINPEDIKNNPQEYFQTLTEFLIGWLINHILHVDKKIPVK